MTGPLTWTTPDGTVFPISEGLVLQISETLLARAKQVKHGEMCEYWGEHRMRHDCTCDHAYRVREDTARAMAAAIEACIHAHGHDQLPDEAIPAALDMLCNWRNS